jgi:uncharacterized glyoxalase superfamily protein PhnB
LTDRQRQRASAFVVAAKYNIRANPPEDQSWGIRDFILVDPTGVPWRIGQNIS